MKVIFCMRFIVIIISFEKLFIKKKMDEGMRYNFV